MRSITHELSQNTPEIPKIVMPKPPPRPFVDSRAPYPIVYTGVDVLVVHHHVARLRDTGEEPDICIKPRVEKERCGCRIIWPYWAARQGIGFLDADLLDDVVTKEENFEGEGDAKMDDSDYWNKKASGLLFGLEED